MKSIRPYRIIFRRFENNRAGTVAENHAGRAIGVVDDRRHHVGADHQDFLVRSGRNELRARLQRVHERRTSRRKDRNPNVLRAQFVLHQAGGGGEKHVGCDGGHDDGIQIGCFDATLGSTLSWQLRQQDRWWRRPYRRYAVRESRFAP